MMFTDGLDEKAISWVKEGSDLAQQVRSPLVDKFPLDPPVRPTHQTLLLHKSNTFASPKVVLPPVKYHSGLLRTPRNLLIPSDDEAAEDDESVASAPEVYCENYSDTCEEGMGSSDSDLFGKRSKTSCEEEAVSSASSSDEPPIASQGKRHRRLVRGLSKENLRVEIAEIFSGNIMDELQTQSNAADSHREHEQGGLHASNLHNFPDLGTPSAPPIGVDVSEESSVQIEDAVNFKNISNEVSSDFRNREQQLEQQQSIPTPVEAGMQVPVWQNTATVQTPNYNTSTQNAWQTFIAYEACFRLCLNAWARNCMEAPEFLRDECATLRNAFGIQNFLLQPRGHIQVDRKCVNNQEVINTARGRRMMTQIEVEVKRIRIIPQRRKLKSTSSYRAMYTQAGAEYIRHVSAILKNQISTIKASPFSVVPEETLLCLLKLKSSSEDALADASPHLSLKPGTGDSLVLCPEGHGDALLIEIQDINKASQGHATVQISELADSPGEVNKWWPIYNEQNCCAGKIQLCISASGSGERINHSKMLQGGPVVETMMYDLVLEAAMRAQKFHSKNLQINGVWKWLLLEFADYYGVSDAYTKLRYLSYIMSIATPTKECLELIYELLLPILRARDEKSLTRQERSILLDCEDQINKLLEITFENYKSLDELSTTGLTDIFGPIPESGAPALVPAFQIFSLLHDILSQESQSILIKYFQNSAARRCRRHMVETDEFVSGSCDGLLADSMTISTAYLKMKMLCISIKTEIQADIKIHNQHILPSCIDLPNITAPVYSIELCKRLRKFLAACPPSKPSQHVAELLIATADFERDLDSWNIRRVHGGVTSKDLFHDYIMVWIQASRLHLLDLCKTDKVMCSAVSANFQTTPFVEHIYDQIRESLNEYEVVLNRWPQYLTSLETVVADVERAILKALEKSYSDCLIPLRDGIPKLLEKKMQKLTRRQSSSTYIVPNELGTFLNTLKRILDVLHNRVEETLKSWVVYLATADGTACFGEQMNAITVTLRKKYKKYLQGIVEKLVDNTEANKLTKLKRILEETDAAEGENEIRERMQVLCSLLTDSIHNLHGVLSSRIFVAICRELWDKMGKIVLNFLESRKENRIWYRGSGYALGILDDLFASEMQKLLGHSLQDKDLDPPRYVNEARSILC